MRRKCPKTATVRQRFSISDHASTLDSRNLLGGRSTKAARHRRPQEKFRATVKTFLKRRYPTRLPAPKDYALFHPWKSTNLSKFIPIRQGENHWYSKFDLSPANLSKFPEFEGSKTSHWIFNSENLRIWARLDRSVREKPTDIQNLTFPDFPRDQFFLRSHFFPPTNYQNSKAQKLHTQYSTLKI